MSASEAFWIGYAKMLYRSFYLKAFKLRIANLDMILGGIVAFTSSASVAVWRIWDILPTLWTLLTVAMQFVGFLYPRLQFSRKEHAINLALPDLDRIVIEMERELIFLDEQPKEVIGDKLLSFEDRYNQLDNKYLVPLNMKENIILSEKATSNMEQYLFTHHNLQQKEMSEA